MRQFLDAHGPGQEHKGLGPPEGWVDPDLLYQSIPAGLPASQDFYLLWDQAGSDPSP
jgi:hypothetical protein